ncbi:MAG: nuclear transport factor 2 family protein [Acidimicrobiales bacterium]|nr:nuclear transport factor 2 family protein [Acidimicrobiales bacterium]MCB9392636.1 nuclear transport factor 2 family protein [Acidimicrobiaceae bacterium]
MTDTSSDTTSDTTADQLGRIVDRHLEAYACPDAARRAELVAATWDPAGTLLDPPFDGTGHDAIAAMADVVLTHYPDHRFVRTSGVDAHHGIARYGWELVAPDGTVAVAGLDVAELAADGRLRRVVGFFGPLPAKEA